MTTRRQDIHAREPIEGAWLDRGEGECQRCKIVRTVYEPVAQPGLFLCAPCSQIWVKSALSSERPANDDYDDEDADADEPSE